MTGLAADPLFKIYAICCIVLCLVIQFLSGYTGAVRTRHKSFANPEDGKEDPAKPPAQDHPEVARVIRAHRNALENIPMFFALGLVHVLLGASLLGGQIAFIAFTAARVLHAFFHLKAIQPFRSISYGIGVLSLAAMMVMIGMKLAA
ncbi:MAG: MAPEG family protein [Polyangiaceae bacterium]|nr:MAPEG family protein [Polyangiaceae bacterium]